MHRKIFSSFGIVLSRNYYSEADAILTLFTDEYGKMQFVAKGIKKLKSKKRGSLEPFSEIKFSAVKTKGLPILTETESVNNFSKVRDNLKKVSLAYYFLELVKKITYEEEKSEDLYLLLVNYLKKLEKTTKLKQLRLDFARDLLVMTGFWPKGKALPEVDFSVEKIIEKNMNSLRVGRALVA